MRKFLFSGQEINKRGDIVSRQAVPLFTNLYNNTRISGIRLTKESVKAFTSALPSRAPASFPKKAGLQTFLHSQAPSREYSMAFMLRSHNGVHCCGTVGDSHSSSQLIAAKRTFTGDSFLNHGAKLTLLFETSKYSLYKI